jgi:hypothetical protein
MSELASLPALTFEELVVLHEGLLLYVRKLRMEYEAEPLDESVILTDEQWAWWLLGLAGGDDRAELLGWVMSLSTSVREAMLSIRPGGWIEE